MALNNIFLLLTFVMQIYLRWIKTNYWLVKVNKNKDKK